MDRAFPCEGRGRRFESDREDSEDRAAQRWPREGCGLEPWSLRVTLAHFDVVAVHRRYAPLVTVHRLQHCVAHLVERHPDTVEVAGSNPAAVTP